MGQHVEAEDDQSRKSSESLQETIICPNCGNQHTGPYCNECGQRQFGRLTLRHLVSHFIRRIVDLETGLWPTLKTLSVDPGDLIRRYFHGQRRRFINPVAYFVVATGLDAAITSISLSLTGQDKYTIPYGPRKGEAVSSISQLPEQVRAATRATDFMMKVLVDYPTLSRLVLAFLAAGALRLFFSKDRLNWAEALATIFFIYAHLILYSVLVTSFGTTAKWYGWETGIWWLTFPSIPLGVSWIAWAGYRAFGDTWRGAGYFTISAVGAYLITLFLLSVAAGIYVEMQVGSPRMAVTTIWFL